MKRIVSRVFHKTDERQFCVTKASCACREARSIAFGHNFIRLSSAAVAPCTMFWSNAKYSRRKGKSGHQICSEVPPRSKRNGNSPTALLDEEGGDAVGKPVARLPPHRSPHEVFPHGAPRLDSLPCQAIYPPDLLFPAVRLAPVLRPCVSGRSFLYGLRPSVQSFPLSQALPASEYYAVSATSKQTLSRLGYSTSVLLKKPGDNLRGFPSSCVCLFIHATA